ncbi:MAG: hypothetical protein NXI07_08170, partial [bacterium]|nr:hypothetical protein [bacterium]
MLQPRALLATASLTIGIMGAGALAQSQHFRLQGDQIHLDALTEVEIGDHVRIENFQAVGAEYDFELDRFEVLTDDAELVVGTKDGMVALPRPDVVLLSGIVSGDADSRVFLSYSPYGTNGYIEQNGELISISTGDYDVEKNLQQALRSAHMAD